jgi:hypothetical protein
MHQVISLFIILTVTLLLNAQMAAQMASDGNWGEAVGLLLFAPLSIFFASHTLIYYALRLIRGSSALASYSASKLNYIALVISLLGILGAVAQTGQ